MPSICASKPTTHGQAKRVYDRSIYIFQAPMSLPHPTTLTSIHASLPHFLPSPALASPVGSPSSQPNIAVSNAQCSTLFVANLGQFVSEHELKDIFSRSDTLSVHLILLIHSWMWANRICSLVGWLAYRFIIFIYFMTYTCVWLSRS